MSACYTEYAIPAQLETKTEYFVYLSKRCFQMRIDVTKITENVLQSKAHNFRILKENGVSMVSAIQKPMD